MQSKQTCLMPCLTHFKCTLLQHRYEVHKKSNATEILKVHGAQSIMLLLAFQYDIDLITSEKALFANH